MTFTLKQIPKAVVETKKYLHDHVQPTCECCHCNFVDGHNQAIDAQASVKFQLNREKLVSAIREVSSNWAYPIEHNEAIVVANTICAKATEILECV